MSLYNMLFGINPAAPILKKILGIDEVLPGDVGVRYPSGRFRDIYIDEEANEIVLHTRNGGGNRDDYQDVFDSLAEHPNYLGNADDDFDCTYADIRFSIPDGFESLVTEITNMTDNTPPSEKWQAALAKLRGETA